MSETPAEITQRMVEDVMPPLILALQGCMDFLGIPLEVEGVEELELLRQEIWQKVKVCALTLKEIDALVVYSRRYERTLLKQKHLDDAWKAVAETQRKLPHAVSHLLQPLPRHGIPVTDPSKIVLPPRRLVTRNKTQQDTLNHLAEQVLGVPHAAQ